MPGDFRWRGAGALDVEDGETEEPAAALRRGRGRRILDRETISNPSPCRRMQARPHLNYVLRLFGIPRHFLSVTSYGLKPVFQAAMAASSWIF